MRRQRALAGVVILGLSFGGGSSLRAQALNAPGPAPGQNSAQRPAQQAKAPSPEEAAIYQVLQTNPITAPYRIVVTFRDGKATLSGTVGTARIHDVAVRIVIALGYPVRDDLKIDTAEANRVAAEAAMRGGPGSGQGTNFTYVYPPPLMGRLDDPFFGFEPPLFSYPAWWGAVTRREPLSRDVANAAASGNGMLGPGAGPGFNPLAGPGGPPGDPNSGAGGPLPPDTVEATIDPYGVAVLRGTVKTMEERVGVGQKLAKTAGVTQVINLLEVAPAAPGAASETPPPPPQPAFRPVPPPPAPPTVSRGDEAPQNLDKDKAPVAVDGDVLTKRVTDAIGRRPALAGQAVKVSHRDGAVTLSGHVPTAYEAMLAYRAAEQVAGVKEVNDRLEFTLPDADAPNPLRTKGRPDDVEPYLLTHVRKQVGSLAHVDQLHVRGDVIEIRGTLGHPDDSQRVEAALRSIPLLRGYRLEPSFVAE